MEGATIVPPAGFPDRLEDASGIADYIERWAVGDVCREMVEEHFRDCTAELVRLPMDAIDPSGGDGHRPIPSRERRYSRMDPASCPPILVMDGRIEDGHHRHRVAMNRGDDGMWCYRVTYPEQKD